MPFLFICFKFESAQGPLLNGLCWLSARSPSSLHDKAPCDLGLPTLPASPSTSPAVPTLLCLKAASSWEPSSGPLQKASHCPVKHTSMPITRSHALSLAQVPFLPCPSCSWN